MVAYITHAVLSGPAIDRIGASVLDELVVTDTIPLGPAAAACPKIRQLSVAGLLAEMKKADWKGVMAMETDNGGFAKDPNEFVEGAIKFIRDNKP